MRDLHSLIGGREFASIDEANAFLNEHFNGKSIEPSTATTPEGRAQDLVYDAWDALDDAESRRLVEEALSIDPGCADALTHLAGLTEDDGIALRLLEQAVTSAEQRLGPEPFAEDVGHFWGVFETRPYMRARFGLAQMLWDTGSEDAAIEHAQELLRLNPSDNQGVRDVLAGWLLFKGRTKEAAKLLRQFKDDGGAIMSWARALQRFQSFGRTAATDAALDDALYANSRVVDYLFGIREAPETLPDCYSLGSDEEAVLTAFLLGEAWYATPDAIEWVADFIEETLNGDSGEEQTLPDLM